MPLWDVEKEIFGATHGEVGAYLLGLWGMPLELLEATALHHCPSQSNYREFSALTAVHVANVLEYEINEKQDTQVPVMDESYLDEIGVLDCLSSWRQAIRTQDFSLPEVRTAPKPIATSVPAAVPEPEPAAASEPPPVMATTSVTPPPVDDYKHDAPPEEEELETVGASGRSWLYVGGAIAGVMILGGLVLKFSSDSATPTPGKPGAANTSPIEVRARPLNPPKTSKPAEPAASSAKVPAPAPVVAPPAPVVQQASNASPVLEPAQVAQPTPVPEPPKEPAFPDLKLQGVFMSATKPSAIINGKMVHVNELILGARVLEIDRSNVTVEFNDQRKTFRVK